MSRPRRPGALASAAVATSVLAPLAARAAPLGAAAPDGGLFWLRWMAALGLCLLLAVAGAYAVKHRQGAQAGGWPTLRPSSWGNPLRSLGPRRLRLIESLRVNPHLEVSLVECDGCELLLAATPQGAVLLRETPKASA